LDRLSRDFARQLDQQDALALFRVRFQFSGPDLIYLDGNSLGRMPKEVATRLETAARDEWGSRLIRAWNEGWWEMPTHIGEQIAPLLGAAPGQVVVGDQTSVNLFKLAIAALKLRPQRTRIITDTLNFPSDLYILQGIVDLLDRGHAIIRIGSSDGEITPDLSALESSINEQTALVTLSHVTFKSGYLYDMQIITELAHQRGALVLWDLSHSAGALPVELDKHDVDFAVGCTYKYLNGGPGSPAFLYVNKRLHGDALSPIRGWWGQRQPFAFGLDYEPSGGIQRFLAGTAPMLSMAALEAALNPMLEAGIRRLREKSIGLTQYAIELSDAWLAPLGFTLGSPRAPELRGSHVSVRHPDGYRINRALIEEMNVIPDFREPDNLRLGFAPLYTSYEDVWQGMDRIRRVVTEHRHEKYPPQRLLVT
jgi:kynureninase